jgi:hypothetical protein
MGAATSVLDPQRTSAAVEPSARLIYVMAPCIAESNENWLAPSHHACR